MRKNLVSNKGFGKNNKSALMSTTAMIFAGAMLISSGAQADPANSWNYNTVLGGNVSKDVSAPGITDITVTGGNGYVSGNASIYENHTVTVTGNSGSTFAYKDNRNNISSVLDGTLNSNMRIVIIDKDGLFFTGDSVVDVQGLVATTGDVGVADIMDGNTTLDITNIRNKSIINNGLIEADDVLFAGGKITNNGEIVAANIGGRILLTTADQVTIDTATGDAQIDTKATGYIINTGSVTAEDAGLVALVSPFVTNDGVISAKAGSAVIAAADTVTLDMYGDGLVELAVDGELKDALITNKDTISAEGGVVNITAKAAKFVVEDLINNKGVITASSATIGAGGEIILDGGSEGTIRNSGEISTTSGGSISISGERFVMASVPVPDQKPSFKQQIVQDAPEADPIVKSGGGNINIATNGSVEIYDGVIDAQGGNLNIDNEGVFYSEDANTLKTAGKGTIELNQNQIVIPPVVQFFLNILDITIPQASLQNAIDAVDNKGTGRNTINASAGTFEAVTVDHANMTLNGANAGISAVGGERGAETVINPNSPGITVVADNAVIDGFSVSGSAEPGIFVDNADNVSILNNDVGGGTTTHGILMYQSNGSTVSGNNVHDVEKAGIYAFNSLNMMISDNNVVNAETGVRLYQGRNYKVLNNTISDIVGITRLGDGVYMDNVYNTQVSGNTITNVNDDGIFGTITNGLITVSDNTITNVGYATPDFGNGIEFYNAGGSFDVFGNTVTGTQDVGIMAKGSAASALWYDIKDNIISDTGTDGIRVDKKGRSITGNTVTDAAEHGINVTLSNNVNIADNEVENTGFDGVLLTESTGATINDNDIDNTGLNGINVLNTAGVNIGSNEISNTDLNGVLVTTSAGAIVEDNTISATGENGVKVISSNNAKINGNDISDTTLHGILATNSANLFVNYNTIHAVGQSGVRLYMDSRATVQGNVIYDAVQSGIYIQESSDTVIGGLGLGEGNDISDAETGIRLFQGRRYKVLGNNIHDIYAPSRLGDGIYLESLSDTQVSGNTITNVSDDGIFGMITNGVITVSDNTITNVGWGTVDFGNGIEFYNAGGSFNIFGNTVAGTQDVGIMAKNSAASALWYDIKDNIISDTGTDGIRVDKKGRNITGNTITDAAEHGIQISASDNVNISANDVTGSGWNGLYLSGLNNGTVTLTSNVFTDNGSDAYAQARFESGHIDLSDVLTPNVFVKTTLDTGTAMQFDDMNGFASGKLSIVGQTLGATEFTGYTDAGNFYVRFEDGAILDQFTFEPIVIDAQNASFDGIVPATFGGVLPAPTLNFLEERLFDADDAIFNGRGQIFVGEEEVAPLTFGITNFQSFFQSREFTDPTSNGASLRITGLPSTGGTPPQTPADLAGIEPAAGGEEGTVGDLANLEPAAGGEPDAQVTCVGDVYSSLGNGPVTYNFGGSVTDSIIGASDCQAN